MERKPLPDWCVVGAPAALLTDYSPPQATLVTINKVNKVTVTVTDRRGWPTALSVARGLTYSTGTWGRLTGLLPVDDLRVVLVLERQRRAYTAQVVQDALADWVGTGDNASLQIAVTHLAPYVAANASDRT